MGESVTRDLPLVSIGVPVYNGENYLRQALESITNQTYRNLEILIADNASTDGTEAICREFAARDERIRYHRHPTNLGALSQPRVRACSQPPASTSGLRPTTTRWRPH